MSQVNYKLHIREDELYIRYSDTSKPFLDSKKIVFENAIGNTDYALFVGMFSMNLEIICLVFIKHTELEKLYKYRLVNSEYFKQIENNKVDLFKFLSKNYQL